MFHGEDLSPPFSILAAAGRGASLEFRRKMR
jgi:hypothetical protein